MQEVESDSVSPDGAAVRDCQAGRRHEPRRFVSLAFAVLFAVSARGEVDEAKSPPTGSLLVLSALADAETDLAELLNLRRDQGWQVTVRRAQGSSASLIAAIVAEEQKRNAALSHVLLVGSDSSLPMAREPDSLLQRGEGGSFVLTDDIYGLPDAKGVPCLAVGRLPTDDHAALQWLAGKIVRYEQNVEHLAPEIFVLTGREPASTEPVVGAISQQTLADGISEACVEEVRLRLPRLQLRVRTAFPGPNHYAFVQGPEVLRAGLSRQPMMAAYYGHASRSRFATFHDPRHVASIDRADVRDFEIPTVCGPFVSGGCSMLDPQGKGPAIGDQLLMLSGGPVALVGFTGVNDDFYVAQFIETWVGELSGARRTTLGEMVRTTKHRLVREPQSSRSILIQTLSQAAGRMPRDPKQVDYPAVVRKNNAMLALLGDPTTTVVIP